MTNTIKIPTILCDAYKLCHFQAYPKGLTKVYSTMTPRSNKYMPMAELAVSFGYQKFAIEYLINHFGTHFFQREKAEVLAEYERYMKYYLGVQNPDSTHFAKLHDLGYLPVEIRALDEGTLVPMKVPFMTIENTHEDFAWVTNFLETIISNELWMPITSATSTYYLRKLVNKYALETTGSLDGTEWQLHDFSMRGMSSIESAISSGMAHLLSSYGTDTVVAIAGLEEYYDANIEKELVGGSVNATEHSVMTALTPTDGDRDEYEAYKYLINEAFPTGIVSIVSDSYDFFKVLDDTLPRLKEDILKRDGKVVIRPDSGDPVDMICGKVNYDIDLTEALKEYWDGDIRNLEDYIYDMAYEWAQEDCEGSHNCGADSYKVKVKVNEKIYTVDVGFSYNRHDKTYYYVERFGYKSEGVQWDTLKVKDVSTEDKGLIESLWDTFGGTVNEEGFKVLDPHIGAIYGDAITYDRAQLIFQKLKAKGFASTNIVLGIGSYTFQGKTRDSLGMAIKATYAEINGVPTPLMKDPKTDSGKASQRGKIAVLQDKDSGELKLVDGLDDTMLSMFGHANLLKPIFRDGKLLKRHTLAEIRKRLWEV